MPLIFLSTPGHLVKCWSNTPGCPLAQETSRSTPRPLVSNEHCSFRMSTARRPGHAPDTSRLEALWNARTERNGMGVRGVGDVECRRWVRGVGDVECRWVGDVEWRRWVRGASRRAFAYRKKWSGCTKGWASFFFSLAMPRPSCSASTALRPPV